MAIEIETGEDGVARVVSTGTVLENTSEQAIDPSRRYKNALRFKISSNGDRVASGSSVTYTGAKKARK